MYPIFILPILIILIGFLMYKYPPKKINYFIGYRTTKSMKNKKSWEFANKYCGKIWSITGIIMLIITFLIFILICFNILKFTENILVIIILSQVGIILLPIFIVEKKLKNFKFN